MQFDLLHALFGDLLLFWKLDVASPEVVWMQK